MVRDQAERPDRKRAHDQQEQVAELIGCREMLRRLTVREHRDEVVALAPAALFEEVREVLDALDQLRPLLLLGLDDAARLRDREDDVAPARQLAAVFEGEVEERREHEGRELDRHRIDPVEGRVFRELVEELLRTLPDHRLELREVARGDRGLDGRALLVV